MLGNGDIDAGREIILADPDQYPLIVRPVDKQENYIKRCVGIAGDTLQIKNQIVYINGTETQPLPDYSETNYIVSTGGQQLDETVMKDEYDIDINNGEEFQQTGVPNRYAMLLNTIARDKMIKNGLAKNITPYLDSSKNVFPYDPQYNWTMDNYGPFWIPKKGATLISIHLIILFMKEQSGIMKKINSKFGMEKYLLMIRRQPVYIQNGLLLDDG